MKYFKLAMRPLDLNWQLAMSCNSHELRLQHAVAHVSKSRDPIVLLRSLLGGQGPLELAVGEIYHEEEDVLILVLELQGLLNHFDVPYAAMKLILVPGVVAAYKQCPPPSHYALHPHNASIMVHPPQWSQLGGQHRISTHESLVAAYVYLLWLFLLVVCFSSCSLLHMCAHKAIWHPLESLVCAILDDAYPWQLMQLAWNTLSRKSGMRVQNKFLECFHK